MSKAYSIGDCSYEFVRAVINAINTNCDRDKRERIPMKFYCRVNVHNSSWYIECLNQKDEAILEKYLSHMFLYDNEEGNNGTKEQ